MNLFELNGKKFALLVMGKTDDGEDDWAVFGGTALYLDDKLYLDRGDEDTKVRIQDDWIERIQPTNDEVSQILNDADYYISLTVGNTPDDVSVDDLVNTGLKWPQE